MRYLPLLLFFSSSLSFSLPRSISPSLRPFPLSFSFSSTRVSSLDSPRSLLSLSPGQSVLVQRIARALHPPRVDEVFLNATEWSAASATLWRSVYDIVDLFKKLVESVCHSSLPLVSVFLIVGKRGRSWSTEAAPEATRCLYEAVASRATKTTRTLVLENERADELPFERRR